MCSGVQVGCDGRMGLGCGGSGGGAAGFGVSGVGCGGPESVAPRLARGPPKVGLVVSIF